MDSLGLQLLLPKSCTGPPSSFRPTRSAASGTSGTTLLAQNSLLNSVSQILTANQLTSIADPPPRPLSFKRTRRHSKATVWPPMVQQVGAASVAASTAPIQAEVMAEVVQSGLSPNTHSVLSRAVQRASDSERGAP